ncbi:MAG: TIM barrel protein [Chlorobium sp.]|nr:TIM barrel protein [Chlorobium sp.]
MVRLCAHLGYQFTEFDPLSRFEQASRAGFRAVEWPAIYAFSAQQLRDTIDQCGLEWVQVTLPVGNAQNGEKGLAALPGRESEFSDGLFRAIDYAMVLGARWIHPMAGVVPSWDDPVVQNTYLNNIRLAISAAEENGLGTLIEVIGEGEVPGYAMSSYTRARRLFEEIGFDSLRLILDAYHAQILTGDASLVAAQWAGKIGHVQIADVPGRHEPGTGDIDFEVFFNVLEDMGYQGWVGCEYRPQNGTISGLKYLAKYMHKDCTL